MAVEAIACRGELSRQPFRGQAEISLPLFELALVLVRLDYVAPKLDGSLRRGRFTSSPPQFGQTKFICSAQLPQYVHS
jgi:hypothetical protein